MKKILLISLLLFIALYLIGCATKPKTKWDLDKPPVQYSEEMNFQIYNPYAEPIKF